MSDKVNKLVEKCLLTPEEIVAVSSLPMRDMIKNVEDIVVAKARQAVAEELFEKFICPLCYRLNPHHATADNEIGCKSCQDKEDYCGKPYSNKQSR